MPPSGYSLSHGEDFSGSSLPSGWNLGYYFSNTVPSSAVSVSGGALHLTWTRGGVSDISVSTSATYHYGYFEVRMKWNPTTGAWPAFWMIPSAGIQHTGEIDVFEGQGDDAGAYFATLHEWNGSSQLWQSSPNRFPVSVDWTQYHDYGLLWEPGGKFTWYLDGSVIHQITGAPSIFDTQSVFLILSMQEGANWSVGNLSGVSVNSLTLDVESINVYTSTPAAPGSPVIASFTATPSSVSPGGTSTLAWSVTGTGVTLSIDNGVGTVTGSSTSVVVNANTTYTLTATNTNGTVTASATVSIPGSTGGSGSSGGTGSTGSGGGTTGTGTETNTGGFTVGSVPPPVINSFTPSSGTITAGSPVTLSFSTSGATGTFLNGEPVPGSSATFTLNATTTFVLSAVNSGGTSSQEITVFVHGARAEAIRYHQINLFDREGDGHEIQMSAPANPAINGYVAFYEQGKNIIARQPRGNTTVPQLADQTGGYTEGDFGAFDRFGNIRDSGIKSSTILTTVGNGSWYGQKPRGAINGANTTFLLDYTLSSPYTILALRGLTQWPAIDGDGTKAPTVISDYDYIIANGATSATLTMRDAPMPGDRLYIWYFRNGAVIPQRVSSATITVWAAHTSDDGVSWAFDRISWTSSDALVTAQPNSGTGNLYSLSQFTQSIAVPADSTLDWFTGSHVDAFLDGTLFASDNNYLLLYDIYLTIHLADGTDATLRPSSWSFNTGSSGNINSWQANHGYLFGEQVLDANGNLQTCSVAGTSGPLPPSWTTGSTSDGSVTWAYAGAQSSDTGQIETPTLAYDVDGVTPTTYARLTRLHFSGFSVGGSVRYTF
jgi:beta-glucanase (GH16 family)